MITGLTLLDTIASELSRVEVIQLKSTFKSRRFNCNVTKLVCSLKVPEDFLEDAADH